MSKRRSPGTALLPVALAIAMGLADADPRYAGRIRAAQIAAVVRLTPLAMAASCLNAFILIVILWRVHALPLPIIVWAVVLVALATRYALVWRAQAGRPPRSDASPRALRRAVLNGAMFGAVWGTVPVMTFATGTLPIQLLVGCLSAGMMCAGGFVLGTVPLAGLSFVAMVLAGAYYALLSTDLSPIHLGLTALLSIYALVVAINLAWNAQLFVEHFLAEARLQNEIGARERAQAQVAHAQRMTALGELAGGIAHDFNNILQSVSANASLIESRASEPEQSRRLAGSIIASAERGGTISRRLLAFARQDILNAERVDVAALLSGTHELLKHVVSDTVTLRVDVQEGTPPLIADRAQLETILVNLATNARDAMPAGGVIGLHAALDAVPAGRQDPPLPAGDYIRLTVSDTGTGMDEAILARAAEPFFTTKQKGRGTGLGLSMAKGFAEQSGGAFAIESRPGDGTTVTLWLPRSSTPPPLPRAGRPRPLVASRRVLFVDDDSEVRDSMVRSLSDAGFVVLGAPGAAAALEHLDGGATIDVLISDFSMPGMDGIELIRAVHARLPKLPAILLTGHVGDATPPGLAGEDADRFTLLQKPIQLADLIEHLSLAR